MTSAQILLLISILQPSPSLLPLHFKTRGCTSHVKLGPQHNAQYVSVDSIMDIPMRDTISSSILPRTEDGFAMESEVMHDAKDRVRSRYILGDACGGKLTREEYSRCGGGGGAGAIFVSNRSLLVPLKRFIQWSRYYLSTPGLGDVASRNKFLDVLVESRYILQLATNTIWNAVEKRFTRRSL